MTLAFDRRGVEIGVLLLVVAVATVAITAPNPTAVESSPPEAFGSGSSGEAAAGASWAVAEVLFAGGLLGVIVLLRHVPEWLKTTGRRLAVYVIIYMYAIYGVAIGWVTELLALGAVAYLGYRVTDHYGLYWVLNNVLCLAFAIGGGIAVGSMFGVPGMIIALMVLSVYDHAFANRREWMFDLAEKFVRARVPVVFLRPRGWRYRWGWLLEDELEIDTEDEMEIEREDERLGWGLGTADLALAGGFIAALTTSPSFAGLDHGRFVLSVVIAGLFVAGLRIGHELDTRGSGAGMPPITAGLLAPYAVLLVASMVPWGML